MQRKRQSKERHHADAQRHERVKLAPDAPGAELGGEHRAHDPGHYVFANADGLTTQSDVLVHGVSVGTVSGIAARPGGTLVTLRLNSGAPMLHRDASVRVGFKTPLGEPFVDLDPGSSRARLAAATPVRTESTVEIDDALSFLDRAGRANARAVLVALGQGAASPATSETESQEIGELERATGEVDNLASELSAQRGDVSGLISDGGAVLATLAQRGSELSQLTSAASATLQAVAGQRVALGGVLDRLPGLLTASHDTLLAVRPLIATAMPVASELSRAAPPLTRALSALPATSSELGQVLGQAGAIQHDVVPVLLQLRSLAAPANVALGRLGPALADLVPVAQYLGPRADGGGVVCQHRRPRQPRRRQGRLAPLLRHVRPVHADRNEAQRPGREQLHGAG